MNTHQITITSLICALLATSGTVLAQVTVPKNNLNGITDFMKNSQKPKPEIGPFKNIIGQWITNGTITSTTTESAYRDYVYAWKGQILGAVNEEGKFRFRADNGCEIVGSAVPFASDTMWSIETETQNCPIKHLNQRMVGRISREGQTITLKVEDPPFAMGRHVAYELKGVFRKY